jgi:hypothetical protein
MFPRGVTCRAYACGFCPCFARLQDKRRSDHSEYRHVASSTCTAEADSIGATFPGPVRWRWQGPAPEHSTTRPAPYRRP